jgi:hypothetical protein
VIPLSKEKKHAFHSGIGDNDDLLVKQPASEDQTMPFQYAARMRGRRKHETLIHPEIPFQYGIQYKGDLFIDDNESPYKATIDAYPGKKFEYNITERRRLPVDRDWEIRLDVGGVVGTKTMEWRLGWGISYETNEQFSAKELFDFSSGKSDYIGAGASDVWKLSNDGSYVYETVNRTHWSGTIANGVVRYNDKDYRVSADFYPILAVGTDDPGGDDDDLACLIFRAKNKSNFYIAMWERHDRVKGSWRMADDLDGANISTGNDSGQWDQYMIKSRDYKTATQYETYVNDTGWKHNHFRVYKVVGNKLYRVTQPDATNIPGWNMNQMNTIEAISIGDKTEIFLSRPGVSKQKVFELTTEWDTGSFGIANFSQAIQFHKVDYAKYNDASGYTDWETYSGGTEKTVTNNANQYIAGSIQKELGGYLPPNYIVKAISKHVKDESTGSVSVEYAGPVKIKTNNPQNAGEIVSINSTKKGTAKITPDNTSKENGLVVIDDVTKLFVQELAKFKSDNPDLTEVRPVYTLVKPSSEDTQYAWDDNKKLTMWNATAQENVTTKEFVVTAYAYQDWVMKPLAEEFGGGTWVEYTLEIFNNSEAFNPVYDQIQWASSPTERMTTNGNDILMIKTTEWYQGTFPADILNEGTVTSKKKVYIQIPPMPEHYVEPYKKTPMPYHFEDVHYVMQKAPIGKPHVWMYWEGSPSVTTRNATQNNPMTSAPLIKTDKMEDRIVVVCDPDPRYIPWISGQYIGYGKVNGKRPYMTETKGKADLADVPADVVFLPENLTNIQGPFIEVNDARIKFVYDSNRKTITFSSEFQDQYIWYTDWFTPWKEDPTTYMAKRNARMVITEPVKVLPTDDPQYDHNVIVDRIEVTSNNPFVSTWVDQTQGDTQGLYGSYYQFPQMTEVRQQAWTVGGDYHRKLQIFNVNDEIEDTYFPGDQAAEVFLAGSVPVRGIIKAKEYRSATTIQVPGGQPELTILGSFMLGAGSEYPDLNVIAPNGESFGLSFLNDTWGTLPLTLTDRKSCSQYEFSGDQGGMEQMTFTDPIPGEWNVVIRNAGLRDAPYAVTHNLGAAQQSFGIRYVPDTGSVVVKVNDAETTQFTNTQKHIAVTAPLLLTDVVKIEYKAGGVRVGNMSMRTTFEFMENDPIVIEEVKQDGVTMPQDATNGYTVSGHTFEIHGSFIKPGDVQVVYSMGGVSNIFVLNHGVGLNKQVFLNGVPIDDTKYSISGVQLIVQKELLRLNDWIHIQSYTVTGEFDASKDNYLGEYEFSRIDSNIDFNWGASSPFVQAQSFMAMEAIPDTMKFDFNLDLEIAYPSTEAIDLSNFTNQWKVWDEDPNNKGEWHGPPEAGYPEVTDVINQGARSGWYNPSHADFTDYTFSFKVQERASGDDDMYGAIFRFNPKTLSFYSFEWDAALTSGGAGVSIYGMAVYRNICKNPEGAGIVSLQYDKVRLGHLAESWAFGASQINEIKIRVVGNSIKVTVNGNEKFNLVDDAPGALTTGAWGPLTWSQPQTFFWDFTISKFLKQTHLQDATFRHAIQKDIPRPAMDNARSIQLPIVEHPMEQEFASEIAKFLADHPQLTASDLVIDFKIERDNSTHPVYFSPNHTVRVLELTPSILKPNPAGMTTIQLGVQKFGDFNPFEKITVTQDTYENYSKYKVDDFDVLTFTPADCNANQDFLDAGMVEFVRDFNRKKKVIIFSHDSGYTDAKPLARGLLAEFGFTIDNNRPWSGMLSKIKPNVEQEWMKYPYDLAHELDVTTAHTTHVYGGQEYYMFSENPSYAWLKGVGNVFYSEAGHATYQCDGTFIQQFSDNEMKLWINMMMKVATWRNDKGRETATQNKEAQVFTEVITMPETMPEEPKWDDYRETEQEYLEPDSPTDVYVPRNPEPYIPQLTPPDDNTPEDGFAISWRGYIHAPVSGYYTFHVTVDDGFRLWIDNKKVIDAWWDNGNVEYSGSLYLEGGKSYALDANYYENGGSAAVKLEWTVPGRQREIVPTEALTPYLGYQVNAVIKEAAPLPWNPMVHAGHYYFQEREHYLYAEAIKHVKTPVDYQVLIQPRPQQGAPIIVRDNKGTSLRKVSFYDDQWNLTLENTESFSGNGYATYYLSYTDIDPATLKIKVNGKSVMPVFDQEKSCLQFSNSLEFHDIIEVRYKLLYSYLIDYNHDVAGDVARILLHTAYNPVDMQNMEIVYEAAKTTPFYRAEEIVMNPILNHNHRGFLYMTERTEETVEQIAIHVSPGTLPADGLSKANITAQVRDRHNNPIENKRVDVYRDGELIYSGFTNQAGEVYKQDIPVAPAGLISKYEAISEGKSSVALLNYYRPSVADRYHVVLKSSKPVLLAGRNDQAVITISLKDENWIGLAGKSIAVSYKDTKGITRSQAVTTNSLGDTQIALNGISEVQGLMAVQASYNMGGELASSFIYVKAIGG